MGFELRFLANQPRDQMKLRHLKIPQRSDPAMGIDIKFDALGNSLIFTMNPVNFHDHLSSQKNQRIGAKKTNGSG